MRSFHIKNQIPRDHENFSLFVNEYQNTVINTCYSFLHNRDDAEDAAQQVFIKVWQKRESFKSDSKILTWLYRIAVNTSLDYIRKRNRQEKKCKLLSFLGFIPEYPKIVKDPLVEIVNKEMAATLMSAIDMLPEKQKTAWILTTTGGFSGKDTAEIMKISVTAVESLKHRAKAKLKKRLKNYYEIYKGDNTRRNNE